MANNKIAYGLAKGHGIDTEGMTPKEVWAALDKKGVEVSDEADASELTDFFDEKKKEPKVYEFFDEQNEKTNELSFMKDGGASVKSFEQNKYKLRHEECAVFDIDGNKIFEKIGKSDSVSFYPSEFAHFKDNIYSHNHPDHNSVLSPQDVEFWARRQSKSVRMVDADGKTMTITADENGDRNGFVKKYATLFSKANAVGIKALQEEKKPIRYADRQHLKANYAQHYDAYNQAVKNFLKPKLEEAGKQCNITVKWED